MSKDPCIELVMAEMRKNGSPEVDADLLAEVIERQRNTAELGESLYANKKVEMDRAKELFDQEAVDNIDFQIKAHELETTMPEFINQKQEQRFRQAMASSSGTNIAGGKMSFDNRMHTFSSIMDTEWGTNVGDKYGKMLKKPSFSEATIRAMYEIKTTGTLNTKVHPDIEGAARGVIKYNEFVLREANSRGIQVDNRGDYVFTLIHDAKKMKQVSSSEWVKRIMGDGVIDWETSLKGVPEGKRPRVLKDLYYEITLGEFESGGASTTMGSRELNFKSADALINYNKDFGNPDIDDVITRSRRGMVKKMSLFETYGRTPVQMFDELESRMGKLVRDTGDGKRIQEFESGSARAKQTLRKELFGYGNNSGAGGIEANIVKGIETAKSLSAVSKLVGSGLTTLTDLAIGSSNIAVKTGTNILRVYGKMAKAYPKNLSAKRRMRVSRHLELHVQNSIEARMDLGGAEYKMNKGLNFVSKLNLMEASTNVNRATSAEIFSDVLAEASKVSFNKLDKDIVKELAAFNIGQKEWDFLSKYAVGEFEGMELMTPTNLRKIDFGKKGIDTKFARDTTDKLSMMLNHEGFGLGAPQSDTTGKAASRMGVNPRTAAGASLSAILQFKSYGFHIAKVIRELVTHAEGGVSITDGLKRGKGNLWAFAHLSAGTYTLSMLGMMARDAAFGREVRDPTDPKNIVEAYLRGAVPVYLDPVLNTIRGEGAKGNFNSLVKFAAGPVLGSLSDLMQVAAMGFDEDTSWNSVAKRGTSWVKYNIPRGNPLIALALDKALFNAMEENLDPKAFAKKQDGERYKTINDRLE